jgi:hypothetical protein
MSDHVGLTISPLNRSIQVVRTTGECDRYALVRSADGDVGWRHDVFAAAGGGGADAWLRHGGRMTVEEVVDRVPQCVTHIVRWTREELEDGPAMGVEDIFAQQVRRQALARLADELAAA